MSKLIFRAVRFLGSVVPFQEILSSFPVVQTSFPALLLPSTVKVSAACRLPPACFPWILEVVLLSVALAGRTEKPSRATANDATRVACAVPLKGLKNALVVVVGREVGAVPGPVLPPAVPFGGGRA